MPFCSQCGNEVRSYDVFCAHCGSRQPVGTVQPDVLAGITPRTASILCYLPTLGWIAAVIILATQRFKGDRMVRFHAFQGLYLFAVWLFIQWALKPVFSEAGFRLDHLLEAVVFFVWIFMMIKAAHAQAFVLPVIGELAQKSAAESR
jgi:uncharacterized membrane protein